MRILNIILSISFVMSLIACSFQKNDDNIKTIDGRYVKRAELDKFIEYQMDSLKVVGLSIAIIRNNEIVYKGAFGVKNYQTKDPVTANTIFEAASVSKPMFAYFVMKQVEKGLIELDRPLYKYLPNNDLINQTEYKLMTARMVLCHTSGLPNWREQEGGDINLLFTPGTKYGYSGEGYQYLKDVLCKVLDVNDIALDSIFQEEIVKPIGAENMGFTWHKEFAELKAYGHRNGIPTDNGSQGPPDWFHSAGGIHSNSVDYAKFLIQIMQEYKKGDKFVNKMLSLQMDMPNEIGESHRSIAFPVKKFNGKVRYYHSGNNGNDVRAYCHIYPDKGNGIVMFSNCNNFFNSNCAQNIVEFLGDVWFYV